jgi:hypothetical protein
MPSQRRTLPDDESAPDPEPWELAGQAVQAIRALNYSTLTLAGYREPADLDATLVELVALANGLAQACTRTTHWLGRRHADGLIGHDTIAVREHLTTVVQSAVEDLTVAARSASAAASALERARQHTAHLTRATPRDAGGRP